MTATPAPAPAPTTAQMLAAVHKVRDEFAAKIGMACFAYVNNPKSAPLPASFAGDMANLCGLMATAKTLKKGLAASAA